MRLLAFFPSRIYSGSCELLAPMPRPEVRFVTIILFAVRTSLSPETPSERPAASNTPTVGKNTKEVLASTTPALFYISTPASIVPTFRFGVGKHNSFQFSIQTPNWLTGSVYSVLAQRSYQGWQLNLRAYEVVKRFRNELYDCIANDDPSGTFQVLSEHNMSPFVRDEVGTSLLHVSVLP